MTITRRSLLTSGTLALGAASLRVVPPLGTGAGATAAPAFLADAASTTSSTPAVGVALGSGYQTYFAALDSATQASVIKSMQAANIKWVRIDADWDLVEEDQGTYNWGTADTVANALTSNGMNVVILLYESPSWARQAAGTAPLNSPWPSPSPSDYAAYCSAAATYFSSHYGIHTYELWNEPNLDTGVAAGKAGTPAGWGYLSPIGFAGLATVAYPAIKAADPDAFVLGGTLATHDEYGYGGTGRSGVSWTAITEGATTAQISCTTAVKGTTDDPGDQYMLIADAAGLMPVGTYITEVQDGVGYTIAPPAWSTSGFSAIAAASSTTLDLSWGYAPDVFLTYAYKAAAGQPMWDALAIHPYTQPFLPAQQPTHAGGFTTIPALRTIMNNNGESAKNMWITEIGGSTGRASATWPAAAETDVSLAVTSPNATTDDVHYFVVGGGLPEGCFVWDATAGGGWTVLPSTQLTLATALTANTAITSLNITNAGPAITVPANTLLKVTVASGIASGITEVVKTSTPTTANGGADVTIPAGGTVAVTVDSVTPTADYPAGAGSVFQADLGQAFGSAVEAGTNQIVYVYPPGVSQNGEVSEATQASIITQTFTAIETGVAAEGSYAALGPLSYVDAVFVYCWSDQGGTAGPFGLVRSDGTSKPALAALTAATTPAS